MKEEIMENLKGLSLKNKACYIVISCEQPQQNGNLEVQMNYEGDETLASYLLESAQNYLEQEQHLSS
ncbi:Uncharacterized protein AB751O23_DG_00020 [Chlamydiales bacterium SCGC AB-751-O23]|nr:Uncharacterized protein AB751O23_DG_00020 [Chlamydiales bacterium SCGC AB-751-O23]